MVVQCNQRRLQHTIPTNGETTMAKTTNTISKVAKNGYYLTKGGAVIIVTNGRLQTDDQGSSFACNEINFDLTTKAAKRTKATTWVYLDELDRKMTKKDYQEWVDAGHREAEAMADAVSTTTTKTTAAVKSKATKKAPANKKMSMLDAAAQVLANANEPLQAKAMIEAMAEQKLWTSPAGKTPAQTLYAAIIREIGTKGKESRFKKVDKGLFGLNN